MTVESKVVQLTRTVTVSADRTSYAIVNLPRAVQGKEEFPRLVRSWRGGAEVVVLAPDRPDVFDLDNPPPALVVPNLPGRLINPHPYFFIGLDPRHNEPNAFYHWLPPGRYRLYLVMKGAGQVTMELPGLPWGRTHVVAATPGKARAVGTQRVGTTATLPPSFSYGASGRLTSSKALVWSTVWLNSAPRIADASGSCLYYPPPHSPAVYGVPACPAGSAGTATPSLTTEYIGYVPPPYYMAETEWYVRPPNNPFDVGAQEYAYAAGPVKAEGAEILWLSW